MSYNLETLLAEVNANPVEARSKMRRILKKCSCKVSHLNPVFRNRSLPYSGSYLLNGNGICQYGHLSAIADLANLSPDDLCKLFADEPDTETHLQNLNDTAVAGLASVDATEDQLVALLDEVNVAWSESRNRRSKWYTELRWFQWHPFFITCKRLLKEDFRNEACFDLFLQHKNLKSCNYLAHRLLSRQHEWKPQHFIAFLQMMKMTMPQFAAEMAKDLAAEAA